MPILVFSLVQIIMGHPILGGVVVIATPPTMGVGIFEESWRMYLYWIIFFFTFISFYLLQILSVVHISKYLLMKKVLHSILQ